MAAAGAGKGLQPREGQREEHNDKYQASRGWNTQQCMFCCAVSFAACTNMQQICLKV